MSKANGAETISVKIRAGGRDSAPMEVSFKIGSSLASLTAQFGEEVVAAKAREKIIINLQDYLRNHAKAGDNEVQLQTLADTWQPGMRAPGASKAEKAKNLFSQLSAEDRAAVLKQLGVSV
jgi:hypothetical protein